MALTQISTGGIKDSNVTTADIADQAVSLDKLPHGTSSNNGKFLRANNGADPTFETVNTDLVADTTPQLGGQLDTNGNDIVISDGEKLSLHTYADVRTKTGATNAVVSGLTGHVLQNSLVFDSDHDIWLSANTGKKITFGTSDSTTHEVMRVQCAAVGASQHGFVNLNYVVANAGGNASSSTKLATTQTGVSITGQLDLSSHLDMGDNDFIKLGDSDDLQIYHEGTDSYLNNSTGWLFLKGANVGIKSAGGANRVLCSGDKVDLFFGSSGKLETTNTGISVTGTCAATSFSGDGSNLTGISGVSVANQANNRLLTATGTSDALNAEESLSFENVNGTDPTFTFKRTSAASGNDNIYAELRFQNDQGTNMGQIICRRESSNANAYLDFETKMDGQNSQPSMRIAGQTGTAYFVGNLGRTNNNQPSFFSNTIYGGSTIPSAVTIKTLTNGGETGLLIRGTSQGGGSSAAHSCIRVDATACGNNADQYGIYLKGRQQLVSDTTGYYADVYGSYSTTYCYRAHLQKQVGAYTNGYSYHSKITQTSSGGASYHFRGDQDGTQRIRIELDGDLDNSNNSYGGLSDVKLKENIVDAGSQWEDVKAIKVRNYNFKASTNLSTHKQLGVVAQELETVSAGLIKTENDFEVDEKTGEGKVTGTTKSVKYSVLYMKAFKALQEAMARIEVLEAKVA